MKCKKSFVHLFIII